MLSKAIEEKIISNTLIILGILFSTFIFIHIYQIYTVKDEYQKSRGQVILYTKPGCGYCDLAKNLLDRVGIIYDFEDISNKPEMHRVLINETGQYTVPYIFIRGKFIGGYEDLAKMNNDGTLLQIAIESRHQEK